MAEEAIVIDVEFNGAQQATSALSSMGNALEEVGQASSQAATSTTAVSANFGQMATSGTQVVQRIQGVAGAVQGLVGQLGSQNRTAGLVASLAGSTAQFAAMGSMLGPAGTVVGGILGLATGVAGLASANREARPEIEATTESIREEGEAAETASDRMRGFLDSISSASRGAAVTGLADQITELTDEMYRLRDAGDGIGAEVMAERIRTLSRFEASDRANLAEEARTTGVARTSGGGGGGEDALTVVDMNERYREESARIMTERLAETARVNDEELTIELDRFAAVDAAARASEETRRSIMEERLAETQRINEEELDAELARMDAVEARAAEGRQAMKDAQTAMLEQQQEEREQAAGELTNLLGQTTAALGKAVGSIILGEKSTEEAFKGLAAAFLEMISQYASLKAATEFADAAASFARYDFGGGAAHIGAGLAFTAVAVATGVGAAAINAPPQAPARPEAGQQPTEGGGGGSVTINWNSPVVTAVTRAELGRDISSMVSEAGAI